MKLKVGIKFNDIRVWMNYKSRRSLTILEYEWMIKVGVKFNDIGVWVIKVGIKSNDIRAWMKDKVGEV